MVSKVLKELLKTKDIKYNKTPCDIAAKKQGGWRGKADDESFVHIITPRHQQWGSRKSKCGSQYRQVAYKAPRIGIN
jgi:hypothetical protein